MSTQQIEQDRFERFAESLTPDERESMVNAFNQGPEGLLRAMFELPKDKLLMALSLASSNTPPSPSFNRNEPVSGLHPGIRLRTAVKGIA